MTRSNWCVRLGFIEIRKVRLKKSINKKCTHSNNENNNNLNLKAKNKIQILLKTSVFLNELFVINNPHFLL